MVLAGLAAADAGDSAQVVDVVTVLRLAGRGGSEGLVAEAAHRLSQRPGALFGPSQAGRLGLWGSGVTGTVAWLEMRPAG